MSRPSRTLRRKGAIAAAELQHKPAEGERLAFRVDPWTRRLVRPLLIATLATSVSVALLVIILVISPDKPWMVLVPLCFLVALEGAYTSAWLNNPDSLGVDRLVYRLAEVLLILVAVRAYSWIVFGNGIPSPEEMRTYLTAPLTVLSTGGFLTSAFLTLIGWAFAISTGRIFAKLDVSLFEEQFYRLSPAEQKEMGDDRPIGQSRDQLLNTYLGNWLAVGMVMIILAALSTFEVRQVAGVVNPLDITRLGLSSPMLVALIIYFLAGFWLLSHGRLLRMNARWLADGVAKEADLERGWQRSSLAILLAIAIVAAFLPIGSTLPISRLLSLGVSGIAYLAGLIIQAIMYFFAASIMALTGNAEESEPIQPPQTTPSPIVETAAPPIGPTNPFVEMAFTTIFWTLIIAMLIGALLYFLRERGYTLQRDRIEGQWHIVAGWLRKIWARLTGRVRLTSRQLRARLNAPKATVTTRDESATAGARHRRPGALSPRDQVRYYYLALVHRAGQRGTKRSAGETPLEYARQLRATWPEAEGEIDELTEAFLEARYTPRPVERTTVQSVKQQWQHLKQRLKRTSSQ